MLNRLIRSRGAALAATATLALAANPTYAQFTFDTVALTGDAAPGTAPGVTYSSFGRPQINAAGQTLFTASLTGTGVDSSNSSAIFSEAAGSNGSPGLVARTGDAAFGTPAGVVYDGFIGDPLFNAAGQTAFWAVLAGPNVDFNNNQGIFSEAAGTLGTPGLVARTGDAAPGTGPGVNYSVVISSAFNVAGQTAFGAVLSGAGVDGTNNIAIFSEGAGSIGSPGLVARTGDAAPGTGPGVVYSNVGLNPVINAAGQTAFTASLTGTGVDGTNDSAIYSEAAGTIGTPGLVARTGDAAPGTGPGVNYDGFSGPRLNAAGQTAFVADLTGTGVDGTNDSAIYSEAAGTPGTPGLVARTGDAAPGTGPDVVYKSFAGPVINAAGQTAFVANLDGPAPTVNPFNDSAIFSETVGSPGAPGLLVREDDQVPGLGDGVLFSDFFGPSINAAGQIAFSADLEGLTPAAGVDSTNDQAIFVADADGALSLILREGDLFDVSDTAVPDLRTVSSLAFITGTDNQDGRGSAFNDSGQLVFSASFTDGSSGIFTTTIPEPTSLTLLVAGGLTLLRRRRTA